MARIMSLLREFPCGPGRHTYDNEPRAIRPIGRVCTECGKCQLYPQSCLFCEDAAVPAEATLVNVATHEKFPAMLCEECRIAFEREPGETEWTLETRQRGTG